MRNVVDIIHKKRDGNRLSPTEIEYFVSSYTAGAIPDYQCSALLMAIYFQGMDFEETTALTQAMLHSGRVFTLPRIKRPIIDKHSTGGVGDKVSLILAPLIASCGVCVPMMSGRGLGHTGGTLDKLESIPKFSTQLTVRQFKKQLSTIGVAMIGQTSEIAPADKKLYALRDVTATVDSIPLIAASIMSKKLAEGLDGLVLDVKCGNGAFMKNERNARILTRTLIQIGKRSGLKITALLTDMNNPLGQYVGNSLEVIEALEALKGRGPADLMKITYALGTAMLRLANVKGGIKLLKDKIRNGEALAKFRQIIRYQGGDTRVIDDYSRFPLAQKKTVVRAQKSGHIHAVDTFQIGVQLIVLGGGRRQKDDTIDRSCGFRIHKKTGDCVVKGEPLIDIYSTQSRTRTTVAKTIQNTFTIKKRACRPKPLIRTTFT
jgi:pyrimidine-nucleoside phosphorylase